VTAFRSRIEFALEVTDSIIFDVDPETRTEVRHGPFEQLYGVESEAVPDTQSFLDQCVHPADREKVKSIQNPEELPNRGTVEQEFRTNPEHGDVKWIHNEMYAEIDGRGRPVRVIGHNTDVTERKRYERRLERQNQRLERLVSVVSHDLRNPLNVAQGRIDLAQSECASDHLEDAKSAVDRSLELVEDLLELARAGKRVREIEPVNVAEVVRSSWQNVQTADAELEADLDAVIEADRSRFRQLFENLFANAVEHGAAGTTIALGTLESGLYVEDDGPGIPENEREDVFETGYTSGDGGAGFGLSIVEEIVDAHDWEIRIAEGRAGGARFEITDVEFAGDGSRGGPGDGD
jgi:PAS domain S-box-containing protein